MLMTPPAFIGRLTVTSGVNDTIHWFETGPHDLSATLTPGEYQALALVQHIASTMTTTSGASGASNSYAGTFSVSDGKMTITRTAGSATWYPKVTTSESQNVLTGGNVDSSNDALLADQYGTHHCGWMIAASNPAAGTAHTSDMLIGNSWIPKDPPQDDTEEVFDSTVVEAIAEDGSGDVYTFTDWKTDKDEFPLYGGDWQTRDFTWAYVEQAYTTTYLASFWGPYARAGGKFRYYPDKSDDTTYRTCRLTGPSLTQGSRGERQNNQQIWLVTMNLRRCPE